MTRRPFMQWYPSDWRGDPLVRICSPIARYVWFEMLGLMHEADPYGHLYVAGAPADTKVLAAVIGVDEVTVKGAVKELKSKGVFSLTDGGVIYSRRMIRDENRRKTNKENGGSGGNPILKNQQLRRSSVNPPDNPAVNPPVNPIYQSPDTRRQETSQQRSTDRLPRREDVKPTTLDRAQLDEVETACRKALGAAAPVDVVIGPIAELVSQGHALSRIVSILESEATKPRQSPIRTWKLWARILAERLAIPEQPSQLDRDLQGYDPFWFRKSYPDDTWREIMTDFVRDGSWHEASSGYPPGHALCSVPSHILDEFRKKVRA